MTKFRSWWNRSFAKDFGGSMASCESAWHAALEHAIRAKIDRPGGESTFEDGVRAMKKKLKELKA